MHRRARNVSAPTSCESASARHGLCFGWGLLLVQFSSPCHDGLQELLSLGIARGCLGWVLLTPQFHRSCLAEV